MRDKYEIIVVGYRCYWQTLERTVESIVSTNKRKWRVNIGLNCPEPQMLSMLRKYQKQLNCVEISNTNLNKVGMQRRLVHLCSSKYIVSFDHDSYVIDRDWQTFLVERIESYENKTLPPFGYFEEQREEMSQLSQQMTNHAVGMLGKIYYDWLDEGKRQILSRSPWYDPINKVKPEIWSAEHKKEKIWYCAGAFYVFLREPYIKFDYPGFDYKMMHEDMILSYFFQHHGYRLGDLVSGFIDSGLMNGPMQTVLGYRLILTDGPRTFDIRTVEISEHSLSPRPLPQPYSNEFLAAKQRRVILSNNSKMIKHFDARHKGWRGPLLLLSDGTFRGGRLNPDGRWKQEGDTLSLAWYHWPETKLKRFGAGYYLSTDSSDPLVLREREPYKPTVADGMP